MKQYFIYLTTNLINGKKYIGQHYGEITDNYLGSGTLITKSIQKYGKENFSREILKICSNREEADIYEKYFIEQMNAVEDENFYNLQEGGSSGDGWRACQRWLENHPEEANEIYQDSGKRLQEWRKNNPELFYEKVLMPFLQGSKQWRENHPEEVKEIMEKVNKEKEKWQQKHPDAHKAQVDRWRKMGSEANSQKVECITTGEIFVSQCEAARYYNIPQGNISKCLRGERRSAGKHPETGQKLFWKLVD